MKTSTLMGLALAMAFAVPMAASAQTSTGTGAAGGAATPGAPGAPTVGSATPNGAPGVGAGMDNTAATSMHNPALADDGDIRASKVVGASVYNDKNEKLGSVDDILLDKDQKAAKVVLSVGGVLGVGAKLVTVPYDKLKFPDNVDNNNSRVMMPGETADALNGMPTYHYASK